MVPRSHGTMLQGMQPSVQYGIGSSLGTEISVFREKSIEISSLLWRLFLWPLTEDLKLPQWLTGIDFNECGIACAPMSWGR